MLHLIELIYHRGSVWTLLNAQLYFIIMLYSHVRVLVPNIYFWYILAIDANAASLNVIETEEESNDGALPRAWWPHLERLTEMWSVQS